jgi:hypothetical protein
MMKDNIDMTSQSLMTLPEDSGALAAVRFIGLSLLATVYVSSSNAKV